METTTNIGKNCKLPFKSVALDDKERVDLYMKPYGGNSCQHSFVNLYTLAEKYDSYTCEQDGFLFTLRKRLSNENERVYLAPMGGGDLRSAYETVLRDAAAYGCKAVFQTITKEQVDFLKENFPGIFEYTELRDYAEYIYDSERLAKMPGSKMSDKRNKINKLLRDYGERISVRPLTNESVSDIWEFEKLWMEETAETHDVNELEKEMRAIRIQLDNFEKLELEGVGIYIDNEMEAYAYGTALNGDCFDGLIAKATRRIKNLYKLLYWEISVSCASHYKYFNWEEDVGVQGLRNMKNEYEPAALMRKYMAKQRAVPSLEPEDKAIPVVSAIPLLPDEDRFPLNPHKETVAF